MWRRICSNSTYSLLSRYHVSLEYESIIISGFKTPWNLPQQNAWEIYDMSRVHTEEFLREAACSESHSCARDSLSQGRVLRSDK